MILWVRVSPAGRGIWLEFGKNSLQNLLCVIHDFTICETDDLQSPISECLGSLFVPRFLPLVDRPIHFDL